MRYFVYAWKSKMQNCFAKPFYQTDAPDVSLTLIKRQVEGMKLNDLYRFKDMDLYVLGTFDDEIGVYENHQQLLIGYDSLMPVIRRKEQELKFAGMEESKDEEPKTSE